jgi:YfiH family protein
VLFLDATARVIGAAHAGWKGALGGVVDATVDAMVALGANRSTIIAAVGPCIAQASYEVDAAFRSRFTTADTANERFFTPLSQDMHCRFDLPGYVAARLRACGIFDVEISGADTYAQEEEFFSFRRATHRNEAEYGRQLSVIALR